MVNDRGEYIAVDLAVYMPYAVYNLTHALVAPQHRKLFVSVFKIHMLHFLAAQLPDTKFFSLLVLYQKKHFFKSIIFGSALFCAIPYGL